MARPASNLMQILSRPQHKELFLRTRGLVKIFHPFFGFLLFCVGKLLITVCFLTSLDFMMPGFLTKPFTMYGMIGVFMLSPLGLHFFLAYQEFVFYSFCSYYQAFAKHVSETSKVSRSSSIQLSSRADQQNIASDAPREILSDDLAELIVIMKNTTEIFGPFLLQNFTLMLLHWLLHIYFLCFVVIQVIRYPSFLYGPGLASTCAQLTGGILMVR